MNGIRRDATGIIVGGEPRIDFLPPEVKAGKQAKKTRRSLVALVVVVVGVVVAGYVFATTLTIDAQLRLAAEQDKTQALLQEQGQYIEARTTAAQTITTTNARLVGAATEIDWKKFLESIQSTLPDGVSLKSFTIEGQNPFDAAIVPDKLLQKNRIAGMSITGISVGLTQIDEWLVALEKLPGFVDVSVGSITLDDATGLYEVEMIFNISAELLEGRYLTESPEESTAGAEASTSDESDKSDIEETIEGEE